MTTTQETMTRLPKPLYAVVGVGELAYHRLQNLPARVEALRERITPRMRSLREELPGRVALLRAKVWPSEALRTEVPARVNTLVAEAREVYGGLVAHGEKLVDSARSRRPGAVAATSAIAAAPAKAVKKVGRSVGGAGATVKKAVKKTAPPKGPRA